MGFRRGVASGQPGLCRLTIGVLFAVFASLLAGLAEAADEDRATLSDKLPQVALTRDGITAKLFMAYPENDATLKAPKLEISVEGKRVVELFGEANGWETPQGTVGFYEIDPTNNTPEIVFTSFSGGAHCCTQIYVMSTDASGAWQTIDFGMYDGEGGDFSDIDGDGLVEMSTYDNAFLYAFDCYACSTAPLMILTARSGQRVDITREPKFAQAHRTRLSSMNEGLEAARAEFSPGFFAGWVAQKALLGEGYDAWETMKRAYRGYRDEGFESCPTEKPNCSESERGTYPFPTALTVFLKEQGYL
ncbi:hypothetical protein [Breoghania sp.]|uniref:hypothetical protein n=1 Tax=Breoghania sp. TaxID=2065378 RepID=UPI002AAB0AB1|nr:hypothetical protein [Breoghania sp.]